jgi:hypothetical protein
MANSLEPLEAKISNQATGSTESCPPTKAGPGQLGVCSPSRGATGEKFAATPAVAGGQAQVDGLQAQQFAKHELQAQQSVKHERWRTCLAVTLCALTHILVLCSATTASTCVAGTPILLWLVRRWLDPAKNSNKTLGSTESGTLTKAWPGQLVELGRRTLLRAGISSLLKSLLTKAWPGQLVELGRRTLLRAGISSLLHRQARRTLLQGQGVASISPLSSVRRRKRTARAPTMKLWFGIALTLLAATATRTANTAPCHHADGGSHCRTEVHALPPHPAAHLGCDRAHLHGGKHTALKEEPMAVIDCVEAHGHEGQGYLSKRGEVGTMLVLAVALVLSPSWGHPSGHHRCRPGQAAAAEEWPTCSLRSSASP